MKLSKLYCNYEDKFPTIVFNSWLNIIFWHISDLSQKDRDSHNLWKTTLLHLIDFMLLKEVKSNFFLKNHQQFNDFVFFLQIELMDWTFLTIRRWADTKISIKEHKNSDTDFREIPKEKWTYYEIWIENAKSIIDNKISFFFLGKFDFRKGLWYCFRSQEDYWEVFRLQKYSRSPDIGWKPYLFCVMWLDSDILTKKYELKEGLDKEIEYEKKEAQKLWTEDSYDKIDTILKVEKEEFDKEKKEIKEFDLLKNDLEINNEVINTIESQVWKLNDELYNTDHEIKQIEEILSQKIKFNIDNVKKLFEEVQVSMPNYLVKKYEDLLDFNNKVIFERQKHFSEKIIVLKEKSQEIKSKLESLNNDRITKLAHLRSSDFFSKYNNLQDRLNKKSQQIWVLEERKKIFLDLEKLREKISKLKLETEKIDKGIQDNIRSDNQVLALLKKTFTELTNSILNIKWIISLSNNSSGNIDFKCDVINNTEWTEILTSESEWHSYKKLLAGIFDLSLAITHSSSPFYKTVFHDGIFEWDDDRKKMLFLNKVKEICRIYWIQYVMTLIESDLPEIENGKKYQFEESEIILHLSDDENWRLFKITPF